MAETVKAPVTGSVVQLLVEVGQAVSEGEEIAILESMKMEIPIVASGAGTILAITVSEGESVEAGDPMAEIS